MPDKHSEFHSKFLSNKNSIIKCKKLLPLYTDVDNSRTPFQIQ